MALGGIRLGRDDDKPAVLSRGDEAFRTVQDVETAVPDRRCALPRRIRARQRFRQGERADDPGGHQAGQEFRLLPLRGESDEAFADDGIVHGHDDGRGGAGIGDLGEGQEITDRIGAGAAILLRHHHAHESQFAHSFEVVGGKLLRPVALRRLRGHDRPGEVTHHTLDHELFVGQLEEHGGPSFWSQEKRCPDGSSEIPDADASSSQGL